MLVSTLIPAIYLKATGEVYSGTEGDDDWVKALAITNRYIDAWMAEPGVDWDSTYAITDCGTVTATDTFALDATIYRVSNDAGDPVVIRHTDGVTLTKYPLVSGNQLGRYTSGNYVSRYGSNLKFNAAFTATSPQFGGTIEVPGYVKPAYLTTGSDTVPVDDPNWLILASAAEWTRTDLTQAQNYPILVGEANNAMAAMKLANRPAVQDIFRHSVARGTEW